MGIGAGFAIRFAWPALAPLKVAAFVGLEATMLAWLLLLVAAVLPARPRRVPLRRPHGVGGRTTSSRPLSPGEATTRFAAVTITTEAPFRAASASPSSPPSTKTALPSTSASRAVGASTLAWRLAVAGRQVRVSMTWW